MVDSVQLDHLVNLAMQSSDKQHMRPVIEKELLHYDILFALDQAGLLDQLTFQGGTALRLCYGLERFSEDLDFAGGRDFNSKQLLEIKSCLESYLGKRYGLSVNVKEPKDMLQDPVYAELKIDKWQVSITTAPNRKDIPKQRIKLEVANVPAYSRRPRSLLHNYDFLPDGYQDTLVLTESLDEIMADKLISLVNTVRYVRHRDIWDLRWLKQQGATINMEFVKNKIADYQIVDYLEKLDRRIASLSSVITGKPFYDELSRFIPTPVRERTLDKEKFLQFLSAEIEDLLESVKACF
jgi:predicted nucleotidyltransferase component of viral defense system